MRSVALKTLQQEKQSKISELTHSRIQSTQQHLKLSTKGYEFSEDWTKVTFSGDDVETVVDSAEGELVVTYEFPNTAEIDNDINLKLNGMLHNNQNLPSQTITTADNVDKDSRVADITWFKGDKPIDIKKEKVSPNTTYVAQVTLKPASGFTFDTQTVITFGGDNLEAQAVGTEPNGNNWAVLQEGGNVLVSHEFDSSSDSLQKIIAPSAIDAEYGDTVSGLAALPEKGYYRN